jgi:hypothetical protein
MPKGRPERAAEYDQQRKEPAPPLLCALLALSLANSFSG